MTKRCLMTVCVITLAVGAVWAQQKKNVPAPKPKGNDPSLEVTLKFIQNKMTEQGELNYVIYTHDNQSGQDGTVQYAYQVTSLNFDSAKCTYESHVKFSSPVDHWSMALGSSGLIRMMRKRVQVMPATTWWTQEWADEGYPAKTARVEPLYYVLSLGPVPVEPGEECERNGKRGPDLCQPADWYGRIARTWSFHDEDTANRVAKALVHALELCSVGNEEEPF